MSMMRYDATSWRDAEGGDWIIGGRKQAQINTWPRNPDNYQGNPVPGGSFGTSEDNGTIFADGTSEWKTFDRHYGQVLGYGWPFDILYITLDLGQHYMYETTAYQSIVLSKFYKVSEGFTMDEKIEGLVDGITVTEFLGEISKIHPEEVLTFIEGATSLELAADAVISNGDSLLAVSADGTNSSKYFLEVTAEGLSDDAVLTSDPYTIEVDGAVGTISGFDLGTTLKTVADNVTVPAGALMNIIDANGMYVPFVALNYDTLNVNVLASSAVYFEVIAESFKTTITYQLKPNTDASEAKVISAVYDVDQASNVISIVPEGTAVGGFYKNLIPSEGASMQLKDNSGLDRLSGGLYLDDRLTVTSSNGETENTYFLAMLKAQVNYLAYVLSDVYQVDQNAYSIVAVPEEDLNEKTLVSAFKANLTPASGASIAVLDMDMVVKTDDDDMDAGDWLEVTAGNGTTVNYYAVTVNISSARNMVESQISVYPNPSNGVVYVKGLEQGNRIQIFNSLGSSVLDRTVVNTTEMISIENQGFYFMTISNESGIVGVQKLIVE
jgi:hypothetical protein